MSRPHPPTPSPKRRGGADTVFLPLSASGRGWGGGVLRHRLEDRHRHQLLCTGSGWGTRVTIRVQSSLTSFSSSRSASTRERQVSSVTVSRAFQLGSSPRSTEDSRKRERASVASTNRSPGRHTPPPKTGDGSGS